MCSWRSSEETVRFVQAMSTFPTEMHGKISTLINQASEGNNRATEIIRMVGDDEIRPEDAIYFLNEYLESKN